MTPASTIRLFIALLPDQAVREGLAAWRDGWTWPRSATPVKTEQLHVTLHFLGDVERTRVPDLAAALRVPFTPFALRFVRAALWPHGIAVLEPEAVPAELLALHGLLSTVVGEFGLPLDSRPYKPHVTLARRAGSATQPADGRPTAWQVDHYALMASTLGPDGGYTVLKAYPG